jgi:hypothetical protein
MHLNGWIGLKKKARERHVFTLPAINQHCRLESGEQKNSHSPPALWPAHLGVLEQLREKIYRKYLK